jgi:hypothetical protein
MQVTANRFANEVYGRAKTYHDGSAQGTLSTTLITDNGHVSLTDIGTVSGFEKDLASEAKRAVGNLLWRRYCDMDRWCPPRRRHHLVEVKLSDEEFRALLSMMMASDPNPAGSKVDDVMVGLVKRESAARGFDSWFTAYHEFLPEEIPRER